MEKVNNIFTLIHMIQQVTNENIVRFTNEFSYPIGISTIVSLAEIRASGPVKQIDLSDKLGYSRSTITNMADKLVKLGLVERVYDEKDRRTIHLQITEQGKEALEEAKAIGDKIYSEQYSVLTEEELEQYIRIQKKLWKSMRLAKRLSI